VKASTDYGFSVVSYTGTGATGTIGHGLDSAPEMIILKDRTSSIRNWKVYHEEIGATNLIELNTTDAAFASSTSWNNTAPTTSVFSIGSGLGVNNSGNEYIAYCWHSVSGVSDFGSYTGNGSSTGPTVTTGFKPAFVMIKRTNNTSRWRLIDNTRDTSNPNSIQLFAEDSIAEVDSTQHNIDFLDTGFQLKTSTAEMNGSSDTFIYMAFADTRDAAFWRDLSGNDNDWQPEHLQNSDVMLDVPENNFATLNPILSTAQTFAEGNLKTVTSDGESNGSSTIGMSRGKWYAEFVMTDNVNTGSAVGITNADFYDPAKNMYEGANRGVGYYSGGNYLNDKTDGSNNVTGYGASWTNGDIMGVAYDADNSEITFYKNNVSQGVYTLDAVIDTALFAVGEGEAGNTSTFFANFGQDSSFAGNKAPQGNTDDNGVGDFYYAPPSGYLALCTANLPDPVIDPNKDDVPEDYFNTVLYTGNGTGQSITGVGFQPDLVWLKSRSDVDHHYLQDAVRGVTKQLFSSKTDAETNFTNGVTSFDSDGFTVATSNWSNENGQTRVAWNWLAGNSTSSNTDGSITSTVSVNQEAGFSVVGYTGTGANATVGHGLGAVPKMFVVKSRDDNFSWGVYHIGLADASYWIKLQDTSGQAVLTTAWNSTAPTSSVFSLGSSGSTNNSGADFIAYCFAEVEGYSKFGSYTGNGSADGPFVYCGFRPAFVMVKRTDASGDSWVMRDSARHPYNDDSNPYLFANSSNAEGNVSGRLIDYVSNGFKIRENLNFTNASGGTYIFMAFAEMPFKYSNAR